MRDLIDLIEQYLEETVVMQYSPAYDPTVKAPIHRNGNRAQLMVAIGKGQEGARGLIDCQTGNLYFWDGHVAVHFAIRNALGLTDVIHLNMQPDHVTVLKARGALNAEDLGPKADETRTNRHLTRIYGGDPDVRVDGSGDDAEESFAP